MAGDPLKAPVTEGEVEGMRGWVKAVMEPTVWTRKANDAWAEASWAVKHDHSGVNLRVVATVNVQEPTRLSAVLLWNEVRVAAICSGRSHRNDHTDRNVFRGIAHEHVWTDLCNGSWCRAVDEVTGSLADAIAYLCKTYGITFKSTWNDPPLHYQVGMTQL